jgi:hypothetical protein
MTKYLRINEGLYIRKDAILEVTVAGKETDCEIRLLSASYPGEPIVYKRFRAGDYKRDALAQAYAEANRLICHELEDLEES